MKGKTRHQKLLGISFEINLFSIELDWLLFAHSIFKLMSFFIRLLPLSLIQTVWYFSSGLLIHSFSSTNTIWSFTLQCPSSWSGLKKKNCPLTLWTRALIYSFFSFLANLSFWSWIIPFITLTAATTFAWILRDLFNPVPISLNPILHAEASVRI